MKRSHSFKIFLPAIALFFCLAVPAVLWTADTGADIDDILTAAESTFQNMAKKDYVALWGGLTAETRRNIIRNVRKARDKAGLPDYSEERIRKDYETGGEIAQDYWGDYLSQFDPAMVLAESRWTMGEIKKDRAEIAIRYKKSEHDAILKMFREGGAWKVGLDETFSTRQ